MPTFAAGQQIFTYGSLMYDEVWNKVVCQRYQGVSATIYGFSRRGVKGAEYPALIRVDGDARVSGRLYFGVTCADLRRLDKFEGLQYRREPCLADIVDAAGSVRRVPSCCYVWRPSLQQRISAKDWDEEAFRRRGLRLFMRQYRGFFA